MFKNTASQKITLLAIDTATNLPKTGDSANITAYVSKDDGAVTVLTDTTATELDATNALGLYSFDLAQAETNADKLLFSAKSSTSGIRLVPVMVYTYPATGILAPTVSGRTLDVSSTGEAGIDWANVGSPTTTLGLTNTTIGILTTYTGDTPQTGDSFARIGVAGAGLTNIDLPNQTMDIIGNITGNLSGTVGSVTGAVGSVTGAVGSVTGAVGSVTGAVGSVTGLTTATIATAVLTTQMTEAYAADGVAPTLAQCEFLILAALTEFSISSTTLTVKKLDGSTTAATYTLDSATVPTSRTRAT